MPDSNANRTRLQPIPYPYQTPTQPTLYLTPHHIIQNFYPCQTLIPSPHCTSLHTILYKTSTRVKPSYPAHTIPHSIPYYTGLLSVSNSHTQPTLYLTPYHSIQDFYPCQTLIPSPHYTSLHTIVYKTPTRVKPSYPYQTPYHTQNRLQPMSYPTNTRLPTISTPDCNSTHTRFHTPYYRTLLPMPNPYTRIRLRTIPITDSNLCHTLPIPDSIPYYTRLLPMSDPYSHTRLHTIPFPDSILYQYQTPYHTIRNSYPCQTLISVPDPPYQSHVILQSMSYPTHTRFHTISTADFNSTRTRLPVIQDSNKCQNFDPYQTLYHTHCRPQPYQYQTPYHIIRDSYPCQTVMPVPDFIPYSQQTWTHVLFTILFLTHVSV